MTKWERTLAIAALLIAVIGLIVITNSYETRIEQKDRQIESLKAITIDQQRENSILRHDLSETKEQLLISNDVLKQIEMRNEAEQALRLSEGEE